MSFDNEGSGTNCGMWTQTLQHLHGITVEVMAEPSSIATCTMQTIWKDNINFVRGNLTKI